MNKHFYYKSTNLHIQKTFNDTLYTVYTILILNEPTNRKHFTQKGKIPSRLYYALNSNALQFSQNHLKGYIV